MVHGLTNPMKSYTIELWLFIFANNAERNTNYHTKGQRNTFHQIFVPIHVATKAELMNPNVLYLSANGATKSLNPGYTDQIDFAPGNAQHITAEVLAVDHESQEIILYKIAPGVVRNMKQELTKLDLEIIDSVPLIASTLPCLLNA